MREIKFRGWHKGLNKWVYGFLTRNKNGVYFIENEDSHFGIADDESIGQYTGLKDKNGKEIFEGDILRAPIDGARNYVVKYDLSKCSFISVTTVEDGTEWWMNVSFRHEIIGNIYENPELLGDSQ